MRFPRFSPAVLVVLHSVALHAMGAPQILTNHLGYDPFGPKRAVVRGGAADHVSAFEVRSHPDRTLVYRGTATGGAGVDRWKDWRFWSLDFSSVQAEGLYVIEAYGNGEILRSFPFRIQKNILERATLSDVLFYFKGQRSSGEYLKADRNLAFRNSDRKPVDVHGGWYDASGDYGMHLSHLDFSTYFNPQQTPLAAFSLGRTLELLEARKDGNYRQILIRLADELAWGADFLVRMRNPGGSFYETIDGYAEGKSPGARRVVRTMIGGFAVRKKATDDVASGRPDNGFFDVGFRNGGGFSIAALAIAARVAKGGDYDRAAYLRAAEEAFTFLKAHNAEVLNDGKENIVDDYCALAAAAELYRTTRKPEYADAAEQWATKLAGRLAESGGYKDYWRADDGDRPFFHAADAGAPLLALLDYYELAPPRIRTRIRDAVRRSLEFELWVTGETANPFGLARQYVQSKNGARRTSFFYPHDADTAPWWQGENARLASLATAARLAVPLFAGDGRFQQRLQAYALDQLNWILGLNPFDASMLQGAGRNNPEYVFFSSWEYKSAPGGICNGITSGYQDEHDIDFNVPYEVTGQDSDWRWAEQWIPHGAWYLLAVAAGETAAPRADKVSIGYVFPQNRVLDPAEVLAEKLTHINYAFANIRNGEMVEGFDHDTENFRVLNGLKARNPSLKILVSVGGWTWSGGFSDMALTEKSRKRFIDSALAFLARHRLDGLDVDWEYPGQKGMDNVFRPEDKENCTALFAELRAALDRAGQQAGKRYLLTMATQAADVWLEHTEMDKLSQSLDFVNLMAYDQFGEWDAVAGHHAPLFTHPDNPKATSAADVTTHYIAAGVPASKLVLGVPFYGKAWSDATPATHGLYQPAKKMPQRLDGSFRNIRENLADKNGFIRYWDDVSKAPYLYNPQSRIFVSYEDEASLRVKCRYVLDRGLAGVMFWQHSTDSAGTLQGVIAAGLNIAGPAPAGK